MATAGTGETVALPVPDKALVVRSASLRSDSFSPGSMVKGTVTQGFIPFANPVFLREVITLTTIFPEDRTVTYDSPAMIITDSAPFARISRIEDSNSQTPPVALTISG